MMRSRLFSLTLALNGLLLTTLPFSLAKAQTLPSPSTSTLEETCKATLFDVQQHVESYKKAFIARVSLFYVDTDATFVTAEPLTLLVVLAAHDAVVSGDVVSQSSALDILQSEQMLLAFSRRIINDCPSIVSVTYLLGEYQQRTFGLVDGTIREFTCTAQPTTASLPWGYQHCLTNL